MFLDLSNTFEKIHHDLMIAKFFTSSVHENHLKIYNKEFEKNSNFGTWEYIITWVYQESILGPLLFDVFINSPFLS